jgi:DDE superfamily endonuclease
MIPPFKSTAGSNLSSNKTAFDTLLAKPCVKSEHCIGILKGRFPFLKDIRLKIGCKEDMVRIVDYVRGSVVLHNFLQTDSEDSTWINLSELDEGDNDLDPEPTTASNQEADYSRREELYFYLSELEETTIN